MIDVSAIILIATMAIVTLLIRVLPFIIFSGRDTPAAISYLGKYLPFSIIGMLVVYCIKDVNIKTIPFGVPEIISIILVAILHKIKRNTLLSIICGTICYMILIQFVF